MITRIFLPGKIFGIRLIPKKIVGISLNEKNTALALISSERTKTEIKELKHNVIPEGDIASFSQRASKIMQNLFSTIKSYDEVHIHVPASLVVFKEIKLPLKDVEKIRLVIEHEIETLLPFPIEEAIVDFIVTRQAEDENDTQILAAAIQKKDLQEIIDIYTEAGITPYRITIDLFSLYDLYQQIPEYKNIKNGSAIIDLKQHSTRIAFLQDGELRLVRNIPKGILSIAQFISEESKISLEEAVKFLTQNIVSSKEIRKIKQIAQNHIIGFLHDIQFTLNSFTLQLAFYKPIEKILFNCPNTPIKNFMPFASEVLQTPCEFFDPQKIFLEKNIRKKCDTNDWSIYTLALGNALPSPYHNEFNFRRKSFELYEESLARKQIKTAFVLTLGLFASIILYGYFQLRTFYLQKLSIEQQQVKKLHQTLSTALSNTEEILIRNKITRALRESKLLSLNSQAKSIVDSEEQAWGVLKKLKLPTLELLYKLTKIIDRETFNIAIKEIDMTSGAEKLPTIEVTGTFKSKKEGEDFRDYAKFAQTLSDKATSVMLSLVTEEGVPGEEDGGVRFTLTLKQKEKQ